MRTMVTCAALLAVLASPAIALGLAPPERPGPTLSPADNCFVMKQHVLSVADDRAGVVANPGEPDGITVDASGITARSDEARRDIMAGDNACADNDLAAARVQYQNAIDELTSPD